MKYLLIVLGVLLHSSLAHAEDYKLADFKLVDIPPGDDVIEAVKKGGKAPFDGQIFDINTALRWANWMQQYKDFIVVETERQKKLCNSEVAYHDDIATVEAQRLEQLNLDLNQRLYKSEQGRLQLQYQIDHPPWYESRVLWFALGAVTAASATIAIGQAF